MTAREANFDGLVGPTHNYSGLSFGNVASLASSGEVSDPRAAARQGLAKMKLLADMGVPQGVLPPHERPNVHELRRRGYSGSDARILQRVAREDPDLLSIVSSASAMWAANAATVSPSPDTRDGRVHVTPANLAANPHRAIEAATTRRVLSAVFSDSARFVVHDPLARAAPDEGAANHTRLAAQHGAAGVELFVYGADGTLRPTHYPGRQSFQASHAIAERHQATAVLLAQQHPAAIDRGVFHNDVIAVGNLTTLLLHELAFVDQASVVAALADLLDGSLSVIEVPAHRVPIEAAVGTYLFNSQLVVTDGRQVLIAPEDIFRDSAVSEFADELVESDGPIDQLIVLDLTQSMRNGGGPACLRLRVVLTTEEEAAVNPAVWLTDKLYEELTRWVDRHYRSELRPTDLGDPDLLDESRRALDELTALLQLGPVYEFQV